MNKESIRAVLFDFGGVLAEEGFYNGLVELTVEQGLDAEVLPAEGIQAVYDSGFVLGRGTEADFWSLLRQRTGLTGEDDKLREKIMAGFVIRPWMIDIVRKLAAAGYVTGILSDQTHWLDALDKSNHFFELFDSIYNSYYLGKGKHDPTLFIDVVNNLGIQPSSVLFVDDDAGNVKRARDAGVKAIQYVDQKSFSTEMEKMGINLMKKLSSIKSV